MSRTLSAARQLPNPSDGGTSGELSGRRVRARTLGGTVDEGPITVNDDDEAVVVVGSRAVGRTVEGEPTSVVNLDAPTDPHPEPGHDITPVAARRGRLRSTYGPSRHLARSELRESRERVDALSSEPVAERDRGSPYRLGFMMQRGSTRARQAQPEDTPLMLALCLVT